MPVCPSTRNNWAPTGRIFMKFDRSIFGKYKLSNNQFDAQYLYFIVRLLQSSTCFEQHHTHHQEVKLY
jgi:hypothetical protein